MSSGHRALAVGSGGQEGNLATCSLIWGNTMLRNRLRAEDSSVLCFFLEDKTGAPTFSVTKPVTFHRAPTHSQQTLGGPCARHSAEWYPPWSRWSSISWNRTLRLGGFCCIGAGWSPTASFLFFNMETSPAAGTTWQAGVTRTTC